MRNNDHHDWAAAVALAFLEIARKQHRAFALLHFGTTVLRTDVWAATDPVDPMRMVEAVTFFDAAGGTAFEPPVDAARDILRGNQGLRDADLILITDGLARVSDLWLRDYLTDKGHLRFRTYAVLLGNQSMGALTTIADEIVPLANALRDDNKIQHLFDVV